ncbi:MAG: diacylglycerol/lipid kinase family protein [Chitinophagales bacterium]
MNITFEISAFFEFHRRMTIQRQIAIVSNPHSGKGRGQVIQQWLCKKLEFLELSYSLFTPPWPSGLESFSEVWLIGGDGTLFHFINQYPNLDKPIALFGGGSGNDFAWKWQGDRNLDSCLAAALEGKFHLVDAGLCNGNYFLNGVGIGFDGSVVRSMANKKSLFRGKVLYLACVIRQIFVFRNEEIEIIYEDGSVKFARIFMVSIANGSRYGGGFLVAPQAKLTDGLLNLIIIKPISILKRIIHLRSVERGTHLELPFIESLTVHRISFRSVKLIDAHLDGEYMADTHFDIEIKPGKFKFIY